MAGYCICTPAGGWKYTLVEPNKSSRRAWSWSRSIVYTSQPQDKTGSLHLDLSHSPQRPRPPYIADGMKMFAGVCVRDNTDGVLNGQILVDLTVLLQPTRVSDQIAEIWFLDDVVLPDSGGFLHSRAVTHFAVEPCHRETALG